MIRIAVLTVSILLLGALPGLARPPAAEALFRTGDALAARGEHAEAVQVWRDAYLVQLADLRKLPFRYPVLASILPRDQLQARLAHELDKEFPDEELRSEAIAGLELGFFDKPIDLRKLLVQMLTQEVGGYYDPETKQLYLVVDAKKPKQSWLGKLVGERSGFDAAEMKTVLSHEMTHALGDQHFDLFSLSKSVEDDEDLALASQALVEGDATLTMMLDMDGAQDLLQTDPSFMAGYLKMVLPLATAFSTGDAFRKAPLVIRESLIFPYTQGIVFCMHLAHGGRWDRVDRAFKDLPSSTEQVLHPEKFLGGESERDDPVEVGFPEGCPLAPSEWELVKENVLGEFQTEILLRGKLGRLRSGPASAGWDGDRYRVYRPKGRDGRGLVVWASVWDSPEDAGEFGKAVTDHFDALPSDSRDGSERRTVVRVSGNDVIAVHGRVPQELADRLVEWAAGFGRARKEVRIEKHETPVRFTEGGLEATF